MRDLFYTGSGPYCYSNSLAMVLGDSAPAPGVIEVLTGAPFGIALLGGRMPFFDPYGWTPEFGLDIAIGLLGWRCETVRGGMREEAADRLRRAVARGPVLMGPVEMGMLWYQPDMSGPIGADHYLVALGVDDDRVLMHDPQGYPFVTLPISELMSAWQGGKLDYGQPFSMRYGFVREREVSTEEALRAAVPNAIEFLRNRQDLAVAPGTVGGAQAALGMAELLAAGPDAEMKTHLVYFALRVGSRRLSDAARALGALGMDDAAAVALTQSRLLGTMQYDVVTDDFVSAAAKARLLAPTYERLAAELEAAVVPTR